YRTRALSLRRLEQSVARLDTLSAKRPHRFEGGSAQPERDGEPLAKALAARGTTFVAHAPADWRHRLNRRVVEVSPRLSALADRIRMEPAFLDEANYLREAMRPYGVTPEVLVVGVEPTEAETAEARAKAEAADATILFLYDAHLFPSNRQLL